MRKNLLIITVIMSIFLASKPAAAQNRVIVRDTLGVAGINLSCLLAGCSVAQTLDGTEGQLFLVTQSSGLSLTSLLQKLLTLPGIVDAEADQVLQVAQSQSPAAPPGLWDTTPVNYYGTTAWDGYVNQPAVQLVNLPSARSAFNVTGTGVVAMIDTGVDPTQPVLQGVLQQGYDFTRNQAGGSELTDVNQSTMAVINRGNTTSPASVNQSTMAVVNQTEATDFAQPQYAAFGHGTMTAGVVHLVAPTAQIMPLKAFSSAGTGYLSNVISAVYWGTQHGANVFSMSFDFTTYSNEMAQALNYATGRGIIAVASVGNNGQQMMVYPAGLSNVIGVASVSDADTLSTFSNYGAPPVWVAAPGEGIISTYPFATYAAGWGTSFSAPFVAGTVALMRSGSLPLLQSLDTFLNQSLAAQAIANAQSGCGSACNHGILDVYQSVNSWQGLLGL